MEELLLILVVAFTLIGVKALLHGLRGRRVDDHPVCSACQFDLVGSWPSSKICPECGADLKSAGAVQHGHRRRRRAVVGIGAAMLLAAAALLLFAGFDPEFAINWNALKTDGWLVRNLQSTDAQTAEAALRELVQRDQSDSLSSSNRTALLDHIYAYFIPQLRTTKVKWIPVVERAWIDGSLPGDRVVEYARRTIAGSLLVSAQLFDASEGVHQGDVLAFMWFTLPPYGHRGVAMRVELHPVAAWLDGRTYEMNPMVVHQLMEPDFLSGGDRLTWAVPVDVAPGEAQLHVEWKTTCRIDGHPQTEVSWFDSLESTIEVLPRDSLAVEFVDDEATADAIRQALHFNLIGIRRPFDDDDDRMAIVGEIVIEEIALRAALSLDYSANRVEIEVEDYGGWRSIEFWPGEGLVPCLLFPAGEEIGTLKVALYAYIPSVVYTRDAYSARRIWFGPPISIEVPIRWFDTLDSDEVPEDLRDKAKSLIDYRRRMRDR